MSGSRMVGRRERLDHLVSTVRDEAHCSLVGLPRIGKTSMAREILRAIRENSPGIQTGEISLDAIRGPVQAYTRIIDETTPDDSAGDFGDPPHDHDGAHEWLQTVLRKRRRKGARSVIVIDEFDAIARDGFSDPSLFVSRLREIANNRDRYGLTFVFVSRRSLDMIQGVVDCSTLAGLCEVSYLEPLEPQGLNDLVARSPIPVDDAGHDVLWHMTGGHPFLAEVVMCQAVSNGGERFDANSLWAAQQAQSHEFTNQYRQLEHLLSHDGMYESLFELTVGPQWRDISPHVICLLKHYGIVRGGDAPGGLVECFSEHFRDYLVLLGRTMPSWVLLGDAERQLRTLVYDRLAQTHGSDWLEGLRGRQPRLSEALDRLVAQRTREKKMFGDAASDFLLDYAYIGDLKEMVFAEWDLFRPILQGAKRDWEARFQDIVRIRNPLAHHRQVPADVLKDAEASCKVLLARLTGEATGH